MSTELKDSDTTVVVKTIGRIATIGINRPDKRNCVNSRTAQQLKNAIVSFEEDKSIDVAVLHGLGGNFCSGFDLTELSALEDRNESLANQDGYMGPTHRFIKKPMIAAISGYAVAGGMELALMCDLRVMEENAVMGVFNRRFGVPLIDGGTVRLQAMIGLSRAMDLVLTGRPINAKEAFEWGLANRLVACGTSLGQAVNLANSIQKFPQKCLNNDRLSLYHSRFDVQSFTDAIENEKKSLDEEVFREAAEGSRKFLSGIGKHGKFYNINVKQKKDWEHDD